MNVQKILEVACFNPASALIAQANGADRIELCDNYAAGGITPSQEVIKICREKIAIPLFVIVRPHSDGFVYSPADLTRMLETIEFCKVQRIDGVVLGALNAANRVDINSCRELVARAQPLSITFHRAVDLCPDLGKELETLISLGVNRVLTSGGPGNAIDNLGRLTTLQSTYGDKIKIMPGGGLRSGSLENLVSSGCTEYHSSALTVSADLADAAEIKKLKAILTQPVK